MGRPPGARNRLQPNMPNYDPRVNKPGRKAGNTSIKRFMPQLKDDEIIEAKVKILELLSSGEATTISDAALRLDLKPVQVYQWGESDPDFQGMTRLAREVRADMLEEKLEKSGNFIPWMFLLKGDRPRYRDNYRAPQEDSQARQIMEKLLELAKAGSPPVEAEENK